MLEEAIKQTAKLSWRAKQREQEYIKIRDTYKRDIYIPAIEADVRKNIAELKYEVALEKKAAYTSILLDSLEYAVEATGEYNRNISSSALPSEDDAHYNEEKSGQSDVSGYPFWERLVEIIKEHSLDMIYGIIESGIYGIYDVMNDVAGTIEDFWEGVQYAREILDAKGSNPGKAALFWKYQVWHKDKTYANTISLRFDKWGGEKAPFWSWIEYGNMGSSAYPSFPPTNFLYIAAADIYSDLLIESKARAEIPEKEVQKAIEDVNEEFDNKLLTMFQEAQKRFLEHPEDYTPGEVFSQYTDIQTDREFKIYLTETKLIGSVVTPLKRKRRK